MGVRIKVWAVCCAAWLAAGPAVAQPAPWRAAAGLPAAAGSAAPSTALSGVVVEGRTAKAVDSYAAKVDKLVRSLAQPHAGYIKQFVQWEEPICPRTEGLVQAFDDFVSGRIRDVAHEVGAPAEKACAGDNILVVFTTQPDQLMADVRDHHPNLLGYHFRSETKTLAAFEPPMKSWYVTTTVLMPYNKGGDPVAVLDQAYAPEPNCIDARSCRILPALKSRFAFALVVVDSKRILGKPIGAVADEVAMLVLSRPGPRKGCAPLPTVLDLLDAACPSSETIHGLTPYDEAFLKALYAPHASEVLPYERAKITERIIKETTAQNAPAQ